ncbi:MAG: oligosaccharide flippase family protein [Oligoflexus sp.]|nr:oligosaccharide flippase family protein [Oligoflexus sp.]
MSDPVKQHSVLKSLSVMTLSVGATQVIALILKMIMPRIFGPEKMGIFFFAESTASLFFAFLPLGLTTYINRTLPAKPDHVKDILWTVLVVQALTAVLIGFAMYGTLLWQGQNSETITSTLIMGAYAAFFMFQKDIFQKIFVILGEVVLISRLNVMVKVILVAGSVIILFTAPSVAAIAAMHLVSEVFSFAYLLRLARRSNFVQAGMKTPYLRSMLKVSLPFYLAGVLNGVYAQIDMVMLGQLSTQVEVGYFGAAYKIIGICLFLIPVFQNAVTPVLSQALARDAGSFTALIKEYLHNLMIAALPLAMGLILFGDLVASILNGPAFEPSHRTVAFLTPVLLMMYLNTFLGGCLYLASSGRRLSMLFLFGGLINVALDWFLIPRGIEHFGVGGAGLAISLATFLCETYVFFAMLLMLPQRIISGRLLWNCIVIFLPCWIGMYFHQELIGLSFWARCLYFPFFIPYALITGFVTRSDIKRLMQLVPKKGR